MNKKRITGAALASALIFAPLTAQTVTAMADSFYTQQTNAERADITNWVANSSQEISNNISSQHIDTNNLNGDEYVIQWGDTLSGISAATGISVGKLAYDNNIHNIDLIYAGDILILNRDGEVPTDWHYHGDGIYVAKTKVTINNFIDNSDDHSININVSPVVHDGDDQEKVDDEDYVAPTDKDDDADTETDESSSASSSSSSSKDNDKADKKALSSDSKEDEDVLDEDEFSDAVKDEVADKLTFDEDEADEKLTIDFTGKDDDVDPEDEVSSEEEVDTEDEDTNTEDVYDEDQDVSTGSDKLTEDNAKDLADKIFKQLTKDKKIEDIKKADDIEFVITADEDDFKFNITLTTEDDSDADSESDSESEESTEEDVSSSEEDVDSSSEDESSSVSSDESSSEVTTASDESDIEE